MLNNIYVYAYKCVHIDICIYLYIYSSTHLYMGYIPMNIQDTHDRLWSSKDMKKQISFYLFSTKRLSWEQTDWKIKKGIVSDVLDVLRDPKSLPAFKTTFPLQEEKNSEKYVLCFVKVEIKKEKIG